MRSFLGVPIVAAEGVIGAFYLTEKEGADVFDDADQELIELLAAHAAIAITNARPVRAQPRAVDARPSATGSRSSCTTSVSQKLFGLVLTAESAATLFDRDSDAARGQVQRLQDLAQEALDELRSLVLELRAPDLERDGLCGALRKHVELQQRLYGVADRARDRRRGDACGAADREVLRIAQEALHNAVRHAGAARITVRVCARGCARGRRRRRGLRSRPTRSCARATSA